MVPTEGGSSEQVDSALRDSPEVVCSSPRAPRRAFARRWPTRVMEPPLRIATGLTLQEGGRRSPAVECWASDHWVASSNPLGGKFRH